jgi:hypothetical protein
MVTHPWLRSGFFLLWTGFMAWSAWDTARWFVRWPMALFALVALGIAGHFARIALRQRGQ